MGILLYKSSILKAQSFFLARAYLITSFRIVEALKIFVQQFAYCQNLPNPEFISEAQYNDKNQKF